MRKLSLLFLLQILFQNFAFTQPRATFDYREFITPDNSSYLEFYFDFDPVSLSPDFTADSIVSFNAEILILLQDSTNKVLNFDKTICTSPSFSTSAVKRFAYVTQLNVPDNLKSIEVTLTDTSTKRSNTFTFTPVLNQKGTKNNVSKPLLIKSANEKALLNKGGKNLHVDLEKNYYIEDKKIEFYIESVVDNNNEAHVLRMTLTETDKTVLQRVVKFNANESPLITIANFPLESLKKGEHKIHAYLYNQKMECLDSSFIDFNYFPPIEKQDINKLIEENSFIANITTVDSMNFLIGSLEPIATQLEKVKINARHTAFADLRDRKIFFYNFWEQRNPEAPDAAWQTYFEEVQKVIKNYSTPIKAGYESDRGRMYLKYGPPNTIAERPNEPDSYPYEIWHYYKVSIYNNIKFIFYSPDAVTNDYELLHSDMPQELRNPQWRVKLQSRSNTNPNELNTNPGSSFGSRSQDLFNNPR